MKRQLLFLLTIIFLSITTYSQEDTTYQQCLTPDMDTTEFKELPWFDNNQFLEDFLDSIGYTGGTGTGNRILGAPQVTFWIPVKFWIYRDDNGNGGPTLREIRDMMDQLNRHYNQDNDTRIGFYMKCDPSFINNSQHLEKTFVGASLLMAANRDDGCINVHVVDRLRFAAGMALQPLSACIVNRNAYIRDQATLAHEVGHLLGLVHTHLYAVWGIKCWTECIDRNRTWPTFNLCISNRIRSKRICESTGDGLSDTQADPNLFNNFGCNYNLGDDDPWGDSYDNPPNGPQERPNTANIMSYANDACQTQFTRLQIGVMLWHLYIVKPDGLSWRNTNYTFDDFEPDNDPEIAGEMDINQIQERNFHQQYNRTGGFVYSTQCDVDWVRFVAPCTGNFDILTASLPRRTTVDTRLTLFDQNLTQIAQNDNISSTNLYSNIIQGLTTGQAYFIRVENLSPATTGYYSLRIIQQGVNPFAFQISGADVLCLNDENYVVNNLPLGSSVTWSDNPLGIVSINPSSGNPTTLGKLDNGSITLTATVTNYCGNSTFSILKSIKVGSQSITILGPYDPIEHTIMGVACVGHQYYFVASDVETGQSYTWTLFPPPGSTNYPTLYSGSTVYLNFGEIGYYTLRVSKSNNCGTTYTDMVINAQECIEGFTIMTSPNPATDVMMVTIDNESEEVKKLSKDENIQIELYDFTSGVKQKQWSFKNDHNKFSLSLTGVANGKYVLQVKKGNHRQSKQVLIQ